MWQEAVAASKYNSYRMEMELFKLTQIHLAENLNHCQINHVCGIKF